MIPAEPEAAPTIVDVPRPLWHTYLGRPDWLLPSVPRRAKVGILTLADATGDERVGGGPEAATTVGGLARSTPLALAEALLYTTDVEPMAIIPVVRGLGAVVPAEGWPPEDVIDVGRTEGAELNYIVTGSVGASYAPRFRTKAGRGLAISCMTMTSGIGLMSRACSRRSSSRS